ncbi:ABC transporter ATP-binding protein [Sporosarcina sp. NCCP-2716]|uniref:ABC transporter ATP-binding protein n=1 Tax=Sporosarcina sp. NCCP-2716 TaxID=2943679 RepID=UPI00203E1C83|nr:ABC transporter ATP-binding protein [Sporosarcina sp. NCCP-2716]GKV68613.1 ABC transporter ATP-binding protein [Sporosarcina sp. NCCP-2716]
MEEAPIISMRDLTMEYPGKRVLDGISLDVHRGQIIGYIGPNGAGKSTTLKILLGLIRDYGGTVEIFGHDLKEEDRDVKRRIGYVPENAEIYDTLTPMEYLSFIGELYGIDREAAAGKAATLMTVLGLGDVLHTRISSFSKGMRQKVLIISSLLHDPDILFLDEPLSGLDANSVMVVKDILAVLAEKGKTIFYSSHIMDVVEKISSRIVLLHGGHIAADGTFEELKGQDADGTLETIFNSLTGFDAHEQTARQFVDAVTGGEEVD